MIQPMVKISGLKEIVALLDTLPNAMKEQAMRISLRKAVAPIVAAAQWNCASKALRTGRLMASLYAAPVRVLDKHTLGVPIEPRGGWFTGKFFYGGYQEWGFTPTGGKRIKGGKRRRAKTIAEMKAKGIHKDGQLFVTKAIDEHGGEATNVLTEELRIVVDKLAAKAKAQAERQAIGQQIYEGRTTA